MPRSLKVPPEKIKFQKAAQRRLAKKLPPIHPTGRRNENKGEDISKYKAGPAATVGNKPTLTKKAFIS